MANIRHKFETLEIEGSSFPVIKNLEYRSEDSQDDEFMFAVLLKLSVDQFRSELPNLLVSEKVSVKRVGVDDQPLSLKWTTGQWSEHSDEEGKTFFKLGAGFGTENAKPEENPFFDLLEPVEEKIFELRVRFEALLNELTQANYLTEERRDTLLSYNWTSLLSEEGLRKAKMRSSQIKDVEEVFDPE